MNAVVREKHEVPVLPKDSNGLDELKTVDANFASLRDKPR
jgi:hypothetical protein